MIRFLVNSQLFQINYDQILDEVTKAKQSIKENQERAQLWKDQQTQDLPLLPPLNLQSLVYLKGSCLPALSPYSLISLFQLPSTKDEMSQLR